MMPCYVYIVCTGKMARDLDVAEAFCYTVRVASLAPIDYIIQLNIRVNYQDCIICC